MATNYYQKGAPLGKRGLFQLLTDEAFRSGTLAKEVEALLVKVAKFLKFDNDQMEEIIALSKVKLHAGLLGSKRVFDAQRFYKRAIYYSLLHHQDDTKEKDMLLAIKKLLSITDKQSKALEKGARKRIRKEVLEEQAAVIEARQKWHAGKTTAAERLSMFAEVAQLHKETPKEVSSPMRQAWDALSTSFYKATASSFASDLRPLKNLLQGEIAVADLAFATNVMCLSRCFTRTVDGGDELQQQYEEFVKLLEVLLDKLDSIAFDHSVKATFTRGLFSIATDTVHAFRQRNLHVFHYSLKTLLRACRVNSSLASACLVLRALKAIESGLSLAPEKFRQCYSVNTEKYADLLADNVDDWPVEVDDLFAKRLIEEGLRLQAETACFKALQPTLQKLNKPLNEGRLLVSYLPLVQSYHCPLIVMWMDTTSNLLHWHFKGNRLIPQFELHNDSLRLSLTTLPADKSLIAMPLLPRSAMKPFTDALDDCSGRCEAILLDYAGNTLRHWTLDGVLDPTGNTVEFEHCLIEGLHEKQKLLDLLTATIEKHPWCTTAKLHRIKLLEQECEHERAKAKLEALLKDNPQDYRVLARLGSLLLNSDFVEEGLSFIGKSIQVEPTQCSLLSKLVPLHLKDHLNKKTAVNSYQYYSAAIATFVNRRMLSETIEIFKSQGLDTRQLFDHLHKQPIDVDYYY